MLLATIHFPGTCDAAISFYKDQLDAQVKEIIYSKDSSSVPEVEEMKLPPNYVMHSVLSIDGTELSMTDGGEPPINSPNYTLFLIKDTEAEVEALFGKLSAGGKVVEALGPVFWASTYGIVEDQFGITWQVMTADGI